MGIEIKITADSATDLQVQLTQLLAGTAKLTLPADPVATSEEVAEEQPKKPRARRNPTANTAEETESSPASSPASASPERTDAPNEPLSSTPSTTTEAGPSAEDEPTVVYDDVRKAVNQLAAAKGRDAVIKILNDFGVDNATKLKEEQWADVVAEMTKAREA